MRLNERSGRKVGPATGPTPSSATPWWWGCWWRCATSLLGVTLVLKRFSFIGDGLSHVAFGGMAVAAVLGMTDDMPLTLGITTVCAILLLRTGNNTKIKGDAAVASASRWGRWPWAIC